MALFKAMMNAAIHQMRMCVFCMTESNGQVLDPKRKTLLFFFRFYLYRFRLSLNHRNRHKKKEEVEKWRKREKERLKSAPATTTTTRGKDNKNFARLSFLHVRLVIEIGNIKYILYDIT